ncbi:succinate dehydrogenase assembly factor 2 [Phaeobacter sp. B1627]|uniref:succinate dehydrogenase assembly factor 2 n=1 Tax=Phaeobacter sp. B1627 TaxID=2583809 RepID=UPI00111A6BB6|nr:succinate dehydrogenase assembly factor 2 [Phaeobacter sp. B1627]TNJ48224.1 succinate dehydrogenase assembly factor 2 [Phaeobacter sp. B1627]
MTSAETREIRIKRLTMRSMRRGIKEMDILLTEYAATNLAEMEPEKMDLYDRLLRENDQDLYQWVTGQAPAPERFGALIGEISRTYEK